MSVIEEPVKTPVVDDCAVPVICRARIPRASSAAAAASALSRRTRPGRAADGTLVKALVRAWRWQRMLDEGVYTTVSEIGDAERISKSYVSRILRLALLAPDIVEEILAGRTDQVLLLEQLEQPLPAGWEEQRRLLRTTSL
jgi:hypothetical protein